MLGSAPNVLLTPANDAAFVCTDYGISPSSYIGVKNVNLFTSSLAPHAGSTLNYLHINCRSLNCNFKSVINLLSQFSKPITAIAVTETWLIPANENFFDIPGYNFIPQSRAHGCCGGVGLYMNSDLEFRVRPDLCINSVHIETLCIELLLHNAPNVILCCVYRPPSEDISLFNVDILKLLGLMDTGGARGLPVMIAGDFNIDIIKSPSNDFFNNMLQHSYLPVITVPTRITDTSSTLIDNIFVRCNSYNNLKTCVIYTDISDHLPILAHIPHILKRHRLPPPPLTKSSRIYDAASVASFNSELQIATWSHMYEVLDGGGDTTSATLAFQDEYVAIFNKNFPLRASKTQRKLTPRQDWMTFGLAKSCLKKANLYKRYKKTSTIIDKNKYMTYQKCLQKILAAEEKKYYLDKFHILSGDIKKTWALLNKVINKRHSPIVTSTFEINGLTTSDPALIVNKLNEFFTTIGAELAKNIGSTTTKISSFLQKTYPNSLVLEFTCAQEITDIVSKFTSKVSTGYDLIPMTIMKDSITSVANQLATLINHSIDTGCFPDNLKIAKVCPIYKSGD